MSGPFHAGELAVQGRAGVREQAARVGGSIHHAVPPAAGEFLAQRRFVVLAAAGADGRPWASLLTGSPGFASAPEPHQVRIDARPLAGDPLADVLPQATYAGLLAIDLATRRRMRANGVLEAKEDGPLIIRLDQVYSNCPKYIQRRAAERVPPPAAPRVTRRSAGLDDAQRAWIRRADTFFIATVNPGEGADASHRGGMPGFLRVDGDRLVWPEYAGNMMYNTLGNIASHPRAGVLVPDFDTGGILQLTGRATIDWGSEPRVELLIEETVESAGVLPPALPVLDYSPFNPSPSL